MTRDRKAYFARYYREHRKEILARQHTRYMRNRLQVLRAAKRKELAKVLVGV